VKYRYDSFQAGDSGISYTFSTDGASDESLDESSSDWTFADLRKTDSCNVKSNIFSEFLSGSGILVGN
jgi:hypothetical protein